MLSAIGLVSTFAHAMLRQLIDLYERAQDREVRKEEIEAELKQIVWKTLGDFATEVAKAQRDVIIAEATGENWLQRNWRPIVALSAFFSYWFVIIAYPFLNAWGLLPDVRFGEVGLQNMFWLTVTAVGGYIGGRSLEKIVRVWRWRK